MRRPMPWFLAGVFLISMCVLMMQIVETRLLSVMAWYHLAFFAISMAMFGLTAGSLFVYFRSHLFPPKHLLERLSWICAGFAIVVVLSALSMVSSILVTDATPAMLVLGWAKLIVLIIPPYFLAGMAISLALARGPWPVGIVYGVDLVGAAAGCLVALGLMTWLDGVSALFAIGAIGAAAGVCFRAAWRFSGDAEPRGTPDSGSFVVRYPGLLAITFAALAFSNNWIQPAGITPVLVKGQLEQSPLDAQEWNSYSRVRVTTDDSGPPIMWGASSQMPATVIRQRGMDIDGSASSAMYHFGGDKRELEFLRYDVTNIGYAIRHQGKSAVVGVGGGRDLLSAHLFGFEDVTGVELNSVFVDWLTNRFRDYNRIVDVPGIHLYNDEARSWFSGTHDHFDLIEMSLVDTWAATGAGAYSHSENGLYTVEGWKHFLDALTPDGVLTVSRWHDPGNIAETGRLLSLASTSLRAHGAAHPEAQIYLASTPRLATILVSNAPLTADDLARLHKVTTDLDFQELVSPDRDIELPVLRRILQASDAAGLNALTQEYHIDLTAPTDDRPFFFNQLLLTDFQSIYSAGASGDGVIHGNFAAAKTIGIIVLLSTALVVLTMIVPALPSLRQIDGSAAAFGTLYFALIGLGFMFIEIGIIQRVSLFLGHPVYGLAIGLFSIILSTGAGSLISERVKLDTPGKLAGWAVLLALFVVLLTMWFPALVVMFEGQGLRLRVLVALAAIIPSGVLMGFGFPTGMRLSNAIDPRPAPWFWAVNGAAGVLAASVAVGISIAVSINASLWIGAACYGLLAPLSLVLPRLGHSRPASAAPLTAMEA